MHPLLFDISSSVLDTLFPILCLACSQEGSHACQTCLSTIPLVANQVCIVCQRASDGGYTHKACLSRNVADGLTSLFDYKHRLASKFVITGKYKFIPDIFRSLMTYAGPRVALQLPPVLFQYMAPIPLHVSRRRWRGFNQSEIIAGQLAQNSGARVINLIERIRPGKTQKDLSREERLGNMRGAFRLRACGRVRGENILLVDDVVTTGSTLLQAAAELKRAGAGFVWCVTLCRD